MALKEVTIERVQKFTEKGIMDKAYQLGFEYEKTNHVCSQCSLVALGEILGIDYEDILRAAHPLSGGLGTTLEGTCGALSGGAMIFGYLFGRNKQEFFKALASSEASELAKELYDQFVKEYGSCLCKDVQKKLFGRTFNLWNEADRKAFAEAGAYSDKCSSVVGKTSAWAAKILRDKILSM